MYSPTSLSALELCERKFAWDKVDKIPRESNAYAMFGVETHDDLRAYYERGVMPDLTKPTGNCAAALLAHLPPPQPGIRVEQHFKAGRFHGYIDLTLGNRVWDHKTTSDHKWAKSADQLPHDLQAALYAHFIHVEGYGSVVLQWNYVTRHKPRVLPVIREVSTLEIAPTLDRAERLADRADVILAKGLRALDLPPNPLACDMYGGCAHRLRCNLSPGDHMAAHLAKYEDNQATDPYQAARARAQQDANETGCDFGLEKNPLTGEYRVFGLPQRQNRQGHELRCEVVMPENLDKCQPGHGPEAKGRPPWTARNTLGEDIVTNASDFQKAMNAAHPPAPPPPAPAGNPWDGLPPAYQTETQWYNGQAWVPKVAAPPAPPPPPAAPPAPPPAPVAAAPSVPINPPAPPPPPAPGAAAPPPPAPEAPKRGPGRPRKDATQAAPPPAPGVPVAPSTGPNWPAVADALDALAAALRG